ncbi:hypothetical protein DSO57_1022972 [Entomophthora muscae]|uniref:Uncharacterized protein n=1 Tax=Entomophthora muscae TaxID=34485 RepID=A0ACC2TQB0_9FUNG|nr:hypothetical protein DSO57_1022972 [Entomophthora muscae]
MRARAGAAPALVAATTPTGDVPNNWDEQGNITGQDGSGRTRCDSDITKIGVLEAGLGPGEDLDNPDWLDKVSDKELATLQSNLTPKQKIEVLSCQQLFKDILENYNIDGSTA